VKSLVEEFVERFILIFLICVHMLAYSRPSLFLSRSLSLSLARSFLRIAAPSSCYTMKPLLTRASADKAAVLGAIIQQVQEPQREVATRAITTTTTKITTTITIMIYQKVSLESTKSAFQRKIRLPRGIFCSVTTACLILDPVCLNASLLQSSQANLHKSEPGQLRYKLILSIPIYIR